MIKVLFVTFFVMFSVYNEFVNKKNCMIPYLHCFDLPTSMLAPSTIQPFVYCWFLVLLLALQSGDVGAMEFAHEFFKEIMWRSSKLHVADELQLPPQEECVSWLTFSPIEKHFYQSQHETCVDYACEVIQSLKNDILKRNVLGC